MSKHETAQPRPAEPARVVPEKAAAWHEKLRPATPARVVLLTAEQAAREVFGISERSFHALRTEPWMPAPVCLGPRTVRWVRAELEAAVLEMPRLARDGTQEPAQLRRGRIEAMKRGGVVA